MDLQAVDVTVEQWVALLVALMETSQVVNLAA